MDPRLDTRLQDLNRRIAEAEARIGARSQDLGQAETVKELRRRYAGVEAQVVAEEMTDEARGHHVTDLEHSVRLLFERLDRSTASS